MFDKIRKNTWPCYSGEYHSLTNFKIFIPLLVFVCVIGLSFNDSVYAQSYTGVLDLDYISSTAYSGDKITFSGYLTTTSGHIVPDATIKIKDNIRFGSDTTIKTLTTDSGGYFSGTWTAQVRDSGKWDFYAEFDGSSDVEQARSDTYNVQVYSSSSSSSSSDDMFDDSYSDDMFDDSYSDDMFDDSYSEPMYSDEYTVGVLVLDYIPSTAYPDDKITFSGYLTTTSGHIVPDATIKIKDNVRFGSDTTIKTLTTDSGGYFSGTWTAQVRDSGKWDFYAEFDGSSDVEQARSDTYSVEISKQTVDIILDPIPNSARPGDKITFSGYLTTPFGYPVAYDTITIKDDRSLNTDTTIMRLTTDANGYFSGTWIAKVRSGAWDFYAQYAGYSSIEKDRSDTYSVKVSKYPTSITLDSLLASARIGDRITFSGTLNIDSHNPANSVVYIKDNDFAGHDDLLATAYVYSNGSFSTTWLVTEVDFIGSAAEIFAVYEGNKFTERAATTKTKLLILDPLPSIPPTPSDNEYMELYYSLPFDKAPLVAIVLHPGYVDQVKSHIIPVKEGIKMSTLQLEQKYGGYWNIDFDVIYPGSKFKSKPDIVMNLITSEQDTNCNDAWGWAYVNGIKPLQTTVCSNYSNVPRDSDGVSATAAHEFIHAMGLGHTFYGVNDLMCSAEDDISTCPNLINSKRKDFSDLNLEAIKALYGSDGFLDPNNNIVHKTQFPINNFNNWDDSNPIIQTTTSSPKIVTTSPTTELTTTSSPSPTPSCAELILNAIFTSESLDDISCLNSFFAFFNQ